MIISSFSKKLNIPISEAARILLSSKCISYLEDYYGTLHQLSNDDVVDELLEMSGILAG